ncbi:1151_t:CDS:2, partial [Scutellospora calospora]
MQSTKNEDKRILNGECTLPEDYISSSIEYITAIGNVAESFFPLLKVATTVVSEIYKVYDNAKYNLNICDSLMDRVNAAEVVIKTLERRRVMNKENFQNLEYHKSFLRFIEILGKIKSFIGEVSTIQGFNKFFNATVTRNKFSNLINEFEVTMNELHFTMCVSDEEQRRIDQQSLDFDIKTMSKFLEKIEGNIIDNENTLNTVLQEVMIIKKQMETSNAKKFRVTNIPSNELSDPIFCNTNRVQGRKEPYILKKIYKGQDVICKPATIVQDDTEDTWQDVRYRASLQKIFLDLCKLASQNDNNDDLTSNLNLLPDNYEDHKKY